MGRFIKFLLILIGVLLIVGVPVYLNFYYFNGERDTGTADMEEAGSLEYDYEVSAETPEVFLQESVGVPTSREDKAVKKEEYSNGYEVTVYNQDFGLVKDSRELSFDKGFNKVQFKGVPTRIQPETVIFHDLDYKETEVVEQNYEYDLVSQNKILEKYLEKDIKVYSGVGDSVKEYQGKLLSYLGGIMIDTGSGVVSLSDIKSIEFPELPNGLISKPTLVWGIDASRGGAHRTQTSYLTGGFNWEADYVAKVNQTDDGLDLKGWATIDNTSGATYENAKLKLIAGEVHRVEESKTYRDMPMMDIEESTGVGFGGGGFQEESFFEYHIYSLGRLTNLKDNQKKQISLLNAASVPVVKEFEYDEEKSYDKVRVVVSLENKKEKGLGMPLPAGVMRIYKTDSEGQLQFIGEDRIDHTPEEEEIRVFLGNAFDIAVEARTLATDREGAILSFGKRCTLTKKEVELRNQKDEDVSVKVIAHVYGTSVEITEATHDYEKENANEYKFTVPVGKKGETTLTYASRGCY